VSGLCLVAIFTAKTQDFIGTGRNCGGTSDRRNNAEKRFLAISAQKGHFATPSILKRLDKIRHVKYAHCGGDNNDYSSILN